MPTYSRYIVFFILLATCLCPRCNASETVGDSTIVMICSYNPGAYPTSANVSDFMDEYKALDGKFNVVIENMNCKTFSDAPRWKGVMEQILRKYKGNHKPGLLILIGQEAWASYLSLKGAGMENVPVMCALGSRNTVLLPDSMTDLKNWMPESLDFFTDNLDPQVHAGYVYEYDIDANISMIRSLYPDVKNIAFISDNTYGGVTLQALVRKEMKQYPELNLILLDGRVNTIYTIVDEIRQLPKHTAILVGTWRVDMNDGYFMRNATYTMMEAATGVPAFTSTSVGSGYWTLGGVIPRFRSFGKEMAHEAVKLLQNPADTTVMLEAVATKAILDSKKIKELNIDVSALDMKVEFVNETPTFYQQYKYQIWVVASILTILVAGLCISLYFYFRVKRLKDELEQSESDLREAKDRAEEANRLKSAFLANMSHEIRTPLNAIVGFSDVLAGGGSSEEEQKGYFEIIRSNSDLLLRLINDILDVSRLEANKVVLELEDSDVVQLCNQALTSVEFARKSSGNRYVFQSEYTSFQLKTDIQRLQQVLINLLTNAAKFTKGGVITLEFQVDSARGFALFSVTDTGCGIPKEKHDKVFQRFEKLNEYAQGTGLGLSICKLTVDKWGGDIWIDPAYDQGARFVFSHPLNM